MKKLIPLLFLTMSLNAQVSVNVFQDAKLLVSNDDYGNTAPTLDMIFELEMRGKQYDSHYFAMKAVYEYADLQSSFERYSVHCGWVFNKWFKRWEYGVWIGVGAIHRGKELRLGGHITGSLMGEIGYLIGDKLRVGAKYELLYRSDLKALYDSDPIKPNFSLGIKYQIFN